MRVLRRPRLSDSIGCWFFATIELVAADLVSWIVGIGLVGFIVVAGVKILRGKWLAPGGDISPPYGD